LQTHRKVGYGEIEMLNVLLHSVRAQVTKRLYPDQK
jgi:hypothetical protein